MKATGILAAVLLAAAALTASCSKGRETAARLSAYWWKTTFAPDRTELDFARRYGVSRLYVRYFDVVQGEGGEPVPNATITFRTAVPRGMEVVPVVFVLPQCLHGDMTQLARRIVGRIGNISSANGVGGVGEIQIDCDWTRSTRRRFFELMGHVTAEAHARGLSTSATIRLHQLSQPAPPADRGVLMLYNTGDVSDLTCRKPILDPHDAMPYMSRLGSYPLPLSAAYPLFGWRLLTRGGHFVGIMHYDGEYPVLPDDSIVVRRPGAADITATRDAAARERPGINDETILFDLNSNSIRNLRHTDYEKIIGH